MTLHFKIGFLEMWSQHHTVTFGVYLLAQFLNWNWCYNITWENKIPVIRKLLDNQILLECKSHLENELNQLFQTRNSGGVNRGTESHKIHSNSSKSGRIPAVKCAYHNTDFQKLNE